MTKFLATYLLITGIGGLIALAMPSLVVIGLFLFVLPGLILGAMPTLFMYGAVFTAGWMVGRMFFGDRVAAIAAGVVAMVVVGFLVPKPARMRDMAVYKASILNDATPRQPIELKGDVLFELPTLQLNAQKEQTYPYAPGTRGYACNSYCIASLFTPGVTSVTLAKTDGPSSESRTYRLEKRPGCQSNVDVNGTALMPPITRESEKGLRGYKSMKIIASQRALQLGGEYCLVMSAAVANHDFTISERSVNGKSGDKWSFKPGQIDSQTIEIHEGDRLVYRNHQSSLRTVGVPLVMIPEGMIENTRFGWGRETIHSKQGYGSVDLSRSLADYTNLDRQSEEVAAKASYALIPAYRSQLVRALDNPTLNADSVEFKVMEAYLTAIGKAPAAEDLAIVKRLFADSRFTRYEGAWALHFTADQMRPIYDAYTERLEREGFLPRSEQTMVGKAVGNMGPQSIKLIGPKQKRVLADRGKRVAVPELARALGYGDPANASRLLTMLKETAAIVAEIHEQRNTRVIGDYGRQEERDALITLLGQIKGGICLMGPKAADIRDELDAYLKSGAMPPHLVNGHDMTDWQVILVRMGKPISKVEKPHNIGGTMSNYQRNVQNKVGRWRTKDC